MIYMFLSNNPSSGDINSSNLSCLIIIKEFSNQFWDSYLSTHLLYYCFLLILKIYQMHIIMRIFFFFNCQDHFFPVLVLTMLLVPGSDSHFISNDC